MAEFLLQAIGEFDTRLIVGLAVSVLVAVVGPPLGAVATEWLYRFRRPSRKAGCQQAGPCTAAASRLPPPAGKPARAALPGIHAREAG